MPRERAVEVKPGRWQSRAWWQDATGRRRSARVYGATKREAEQLAEARAWKEQQDVERERAGLYHRRRPTCPTLAAYVLEHHAGIWSGSSPKHHADQLARLGAWVEPAIGDRPLDQVTRADVHAIVSRMRAAGRSPATVNRVISALSVVYNHAIAGELVTRNPCRSTGRTGRVTQREGRKVAGVLEHAGELAKAPSEKQSGEAGRG